MAALEVGDQDRAAALDRIGPGPAERLAGGHVGVDVRLVQLGEADPRDALRAVFVPGAEQPHGRNHPVRASRQAPQHRGRRRGVLRLAEDFVVQHHVGVGAEHQRVVDPPHQLEPGRGLGPGHPAHVGLGRLPRRALLGHLGVEDGEIQTELFEQLAAARRLRGEIEHGGGSETLRVMQEFTG